MATLRARRLLIAGLLALVLLAAAAWAWQATLQRLRGAVEAALGPRATVGAIGVGWRGVVIDDLRLGAARGWPAPDELRAQQVRLRPAWGAVLRGDWQIATVEIDGAYASLLRTREGRLRFAPGLTEADRPRETAGGPAPAVRIGRIVLNEATLELYDASVRQPAHRLRLAPVQATLGPVAWPSLAEPTQIALAATLKGPQHDGRLGVDGTLTAATRDASLKIVAEGIDLVALQPYLLRAGEGGVRRGTLDLRLDARVRDQRLDAPGRVVLTQLELGNGDGWLGTFAGVPRQAVLAAMQRDGRIDVKFTLAGRLDDPDFSLNENLATRLAGGFAETLGVSVGGVVRGVGGMIRGLFGR